ncbi:MAG: hypothetical protein ACK5JH_13620 [Anaerocolumna sp.]
MDENLKGEVVAIGYFNVIFYLFLQTEFDKVRFGYLEERVKNGERLLMKDIYSWCNAHEIRYKTKFNFRKDMPMRANIFNYYSYGRAIFDNKRNLLRQNKKE